MATDPDAAITVPLDLFKRLVELAIVGVIEWDSDRDWPVIHAAEREIEQVEALLP